MKITCHVRGCQNAYSTIRAPQALIFTAISFLMTNTERRKTCKRKPPGSNPLRAGGKLRRQPFSNPLMNAITILMGTSSLRFHRKGKDETPSFRWKKVVIVR
ncbi:hypothetical protein Trydic_g15806 [Trypoxylus dichotomus]